MKVFFKVLRLGSLFLLCPLIQALYAQLNIKIDNSQIDRSGMSVTHSYAPILSKSTPAVVSVTTQQFVKRILPGGGNPIEEFLRRVLWLP